MYSSTYNVSDDELEDLYWEAMTRIYKEAEPGVDLDDVDIPRDGENPFYAIHYMENERQREIIGEVLKDSKIKEKNYSKIAGSWMLDTGPNANLEVVNEIREEEGLKPIIDKEEEQN